MKRTKNKPNYHKTPTVVALLIFFLVLVGVILAYYRLTNKPAARNDSGIDLSPATEQEKQDSNEHKENTAKREDAPPSTPSTTAVIPIVVDASQYSNKVEVRSYVPDIYEDGGVCIFTFTKGSLKLTKESAANKGATTTGCTNLSVDRSEFADAGLWTVVVSYSSSTAQGSSQPKTLEVD